MNNCHWTVKVNRKEQKSLIASWIGKDVIMETSWILLGGDRAWVSFRITQLISEIEFELEYLGGQT